MFSSTKVEANNKRRWQIPCEHEYPPKGPCLGRQTGLVFHLYFAPNAICDGIGERDIGHDDAFAAQRFGCSEEYLRSRDNHVGTVFLEFELLHPLNDGERLEGVIELLQSLHGQLSLRSFEACKTKEAVDIAARP